MRWRQAFQQWGYLLEDASRFVEGYPPRWLTVWFIKGFVSVAAYRLSRFCYLLMGPFYKPLRMLLAPVTFMIRPWFGVCDISYMADIGPGLYIIHPTLGIAIAQHAVIGRNLTLLGGNTIGATNRCRKVGDIQVGDDVFLGVDSKIIGNVTVGSRVKLGANALVMRDVSDEAIMIAPLAQELVREEKQQAG